MAVPKVGRWCGAARPSPDDRYADSTGGSAPSTCSDVVARWIA